MGYALMGYEDELQILEQMGKGRQDRSSLPAFSASKYEQYRKVKRDSSSFSMPPIRKLSDMIHTAAGKQQAILKISSYGKGKSKVLAHLRYISRKGELELETNEGDKVKNLGEQRQLVEHWSLDFGTNKRSRDTLNLVLSTPPGTNRQKALEAAREFLTEEFGKDGHEYVFVRHDDTDHPHIHAVIKMVSLYGKKLNPRKAYLKEARERFAEKCRTHGIDVEASPRYERGLSGKSKRSEFVQMIREKRKPRVDQILIQKIKAERATASVPEHPAEIKLLKRNQIIRKRYAKKAKALFKKGASIPDKTQQTKYHKAAKILDKHAKTMPVEKNRGTKLSYKMDQKSSVSQQVVAQNETIDSLHQYYAVTQGKLNAQGIFVSPAEKMTQAVKSEYLKQIAKQQENSVDIH